MNLVSEIMNPDFLCCTSLTRIDEIERIMKDQVIKEIPVVDSMFEKKFIGIITENEIIKKSQEEGVDHSRLNAEKCLVENPTVIYAESSIEECARLMNMRKILRLPVVDSGGRYCGVVEKENLIFKENSHVLTTDEKIDEASEESFPASDPLGFMSKSKTDKELHQADI